MCIYALLNTVLSDVPEWLIVPAVLVTGVAAIGGEIVLGRQPQHGPAAAGPTDRTGTDVRRVNGEHRG